ncbi:hypothetical protein CPC08DRAFT_653676 [Agrocybe pediades]|nr:hypothetical protein CPC08DRAFT_653676 [Agrocybe pediades]
MDVDSDRHLNIGRRSIRDPPSFDFTMRRHSIAVGQNPITLPNLSSLHGTKRKMSADRNSFAPVGEDVDPQLVGPGIPSIMDVDVDAPAPKRRGSTIDTRRIAQLSLNDRRNSVDSRSSHWPSNDRRDSAPSLFPTVTVPGINSFNHGYNSSDAPNTRMSSSLAPFSWPSTSQSEDSSAASSHDGASHTGRVFDPVHESNTIPPPANYLSDRRMSVPDELTHRSSSRTVHSRSRPPSRQQTADHSGVSSGQEDFQPSTSTPSTAKPGGKEPGSTPYSRSPELRVSHKLAERKRRKEMKDLFDELREQLPSDRGMKASKWEILSKAIEYVTNLKQSHKMLEQEIISLKQQLGQQQQRQDSLSNFSSGISAPHPGYSQGPSLYNSAAPHMQQSHAALNHSGHADSRSESAQNAYSSPNPNPSSSTQNGTSHRDLHPT